MFLLLLMIKFWMTGDNNGRWAGSYDWPDDQAAYLANAEDTILRLRPHASLMLWCGGNELHPAALSPPPLIADGLRRLLGDLDRYRPYIPSSMSPQSPIEDLFDNNYALAPQVNAFVRKQWQIGS